MGFQKKLKWLCLRASSIICSWDQTAHLITTLHNEKAQQIIAVTVATSHSAWQSPSKTPHLAPTICTQMCTHAAHSIKQKNASKRSLYYSKSHHGVWLVLPIIRIHLRSEFFLPTTLCLAYTIPHLSKQTHKTLCHILVTTWRSPPPRLWIHQSMTEKF